MKFGTYPIQKVQGTILAHSTRLLGRMLKKGHLITEKDIQNFIKEGITKLTVVKLEQSDVPEDEAAYQISQCLGGARIKLGKAFTGRCNLISLDHGLLSFSTDQLDKINLIDSSITIASLPPFEVVAPGQLIATIKIIPFAIPTTLLHHVTNVMQKFGPIFSIAPFKNKQIGLIMSKLPSIKNSTINKTLKVTKDRVQSLGGQIDIVLQVDHKQKLVENAIRQLNGQCEIILIFGASAVVDRQDVLPAALESAGGKVEHLGMPVDPGNMLFIGKI